jgi:hypothetical protein
MILIFDTFAGLCNQMYDIVQGIYFCHKHGLQFTFRYASLRNDNLVSWHNVPFENLFDVTFLKDIKGYIPYKYITYNKQNTYNYDSITAIQFIKSNVFEQIKSFNKPFVILKQFWAVYSENVPLQFFNKIKPCKRIYDIYKKINYEIRLPEHYNFLHYRYEHDFVNHFNIKEVKSLDELLDANLFKNDLPVYIASTNINKLLKKQHNSVFYKKENYNLNFEEYAFIDFLFGKNSKKVYGHNNSSFSSVLNLLKSTNNYYNI